MELVILLHEADDQGCFYSLNSDFPLKYISYLRLTFTFIFVKDAADVETQEVSSETQAERWLHFSHIQYTFI